MDASELVRGDDGLMRCYWCAHDAQYRAYHDQEWGRPLFDDQRIFEKLCLEGFQAGLSWFTILQKRSAFRQAFANFDFVQVAKYDSSKVDELVTDRSIVRHRGKIESTINNAQCAIKLINEFGSLAKFVWRYAPKEIKSIQDKSDIVAKTAESIAMSKSLKQRGWSFLGPTTCYAFMQSSGLVNDHFVGCHAYPIVEKLRQSNLIDSTVF